MRVLLSTYESHGDVEPMVGLAVQLLAPGAELLARVGVPLVTGATPESTSRSPTASRCGRNISSGGTANAV